MKINRSRLNNKGFSHIEILIVLVVVVAIGAAGFFVYKHQHKSTGPISTTAKADIGGPIKGSDVIVNGKSLGSLVPKANAQNLSHIDGPPGQPWNIYACITYSPAYGGFYVINAYFWKPASARAYGWLWEYSPIASLQSKTTSSYWYGVVSGITMDVSTVYPRDIVTFSEISQQAGNPSLSNSFSIPQIGAYIVQC
jgi:hypothetical protein